MTTGNWNRRKSRAVRLLALLLATGIGLGAGCWHRQKKPNVIIVIIDTLPARHVGCYGYERSTTPNLDRLAAKAVRFEHAIAAAPWTLPSIASLLTGTFPSRHLAGFHLDSYKLKDRRLSRMRPEMVTLASLFQDHGYQTVGFFNNPFVHPDYGLNKGFDTYDYVGGDQLHIRRADQVVSDAAAWLETHGKKPFFMVVHFFDPHLAYDPPLTAAAPYVSGYQGSLRIPFAPELEDVRSGRLALTDEDKRFIVGLYDGEVSAVDAELGRLIGYLEERGWFDRTLLVVTADHGEEFWERGGFEHGHSLHREVIEVPLVIRFPGLALEGQTVKEFVSLIDVFPTLAEFMGWPLPFAVDGVSLYPKTGKLRVLPHVIVSENLHYGPEQQAFYADNVKLIVNLETGTLTVYDLAQDPGEENDVLGKIELPESVKNQVQHIARELEDLLKQNTPEAAKIDPETIQKLKSLGYISK